MYMYMLRACVNVIYVDYVLMCVSEGVIWNMCHPLYTWILADTLVGASVNARARARTHTHTHTHTITYTSIWSGCWARHETFRWVTALRALNFDTRCLSVDKLTCLFTLPSTNELLLSDVSEEGRTLFSSWTPYVFRVFYFKFPDVQCLTFNL